MHSILPFNGQMGHGHSRNTFRKLYAGGYNFVSLWALDTLQNTLTLACQILGQKCRKSMCRDWNKMQEINVKGHVLV